MYARRLPYRSPTVCSAKGPTRRVQWAPKLNSDDLKVFSKSIIDSRKSDLDKVVSMLDTVGKQETENTKKLLELHNKFIKEYIFNDESTPTAETVDFVIIEEEEVVNDDYFEK